MTRKILHVAPRRKVSPAPAPRSARHALRALALAWGLLLVPATVAALLAPRLPAPQAWDRISVQMVIGGLVGAPVVIVAALCAAWILSSRGARAAAGAVLLVPLVCVALAVVGFLIELRNAQ